MHTVDRNRIDRLPTRGERWVGIVLSALLTLLFLTAATFVTVMAFRTKEDLRTTSIIAAVLWMVGVAAAFLFYRICFTAPQAVSSRGQRVYSWIAVGMSVAVVITMVARPTTFALAMVGFVLLWAAIGGLVASRVRRSS